MINQPQKQNCLDMHTDLGNDLRKQYDFGVQKGSDSHEII